MQYYKQRGAALITSLVILLILTVLGITAMGTSSMEEIMTGNLRDQLISFRATEAGLLDSEQEIGSWLSGGSPAPDAAGTNGVFSMDTFIAAYGDYASNAFNDINVWSKGTYYGTATAKLPLANVANQPVYIIEEVQFKPQSDDADAGRHRIGGTMFYRVTAKGTGVSANSVTLLQTTVAKKY